MQDYAVITFSRVGKNRDTTRESPAAAGAACAASHRTVLFSQKFLAAQKPMTYTDLLPAVFIYYFYPFFYESLIIQTSM